MMKLTLIGSQLENEYREQIISSLHALRKDGELAFVRSLLEAEDVNPDRCVILKWLAEQVEDIYTLLEYPDQIIVIEYERGKPETVFVDSRTTLKEYLHGKSKKNQVKILVALDVLESVENGT